MDDTLATIAYAGLRRKLARGELRPGTRLVIRKLAQDLHISQTPVREAIGRLASEGLVDYLPGAGAFIRRFDVNDLAQLYDVRQQLEPFAASEAARHATAADLDELDALCETWRQIVREMRRAKQKSATIRQIGLWNDTEERFHLLVLKASRNRWLVMIASNLRVLSPGFAIQRSEPGILTPPSAARTLREHKRIVAALKARKPDEAGRLALEHIRNGRAHCLSYLQKHWKQEHN